MNIDTALIITSLVTNARKLRHGSHTVAAAAYVLGVKAQSLCCWCSEHVEGQAHRVYGGECDRCSYTGRDCLVVFS